MTGQSMLSGSETTGSSEEWEYGISESSWSPWWERLGVTSTVVQEKEPRFWSYKICRSSLGFAVFELCDQNFTSLSLGFHLYKMG